MDRFLIKGKSSNGSWACMVSRQDDRAAAVNSLMESFGGSLDAIYWDVESAAAYALVELPDAVTAAAVVTAIAKTGPFAGIEVQSC